MRQLFWRFVLIVLAVAALVSGSINGEGFLEKYGCWQGPETRGYYLSYCQTRGYADFEHAAAWFNLEPGMADSIRAAKVIAVGSSRIQIALSLGDAPKWFHDHGIPFYMLGFGYDERSGFTSAVMQRIKAKPRIIIIDTWPFLSGGQSQMADSVTSSNDSLIKAVKKMKFDEWHRSFCNKWKIICGITLAHYRSIEDGRWIFPTEKEPVYFGRDFLPHDDDAKPIRRSDKVTDPATFAAYLQTTKEFIRRSGVSPACVVLTMTPVSDEDFSLAPRLASAIGAVAIVPPSNGMTTFDNSHLTPHSARVWTSALVTALGPVISACGLRESR